MLAAAGSILIQADNVNAVPRSTATALRYCEVPFSDTPWPISPVDELGATPAVAGCCCVLSAYGKPLSLRCHTSSWLADQTEPFVLDAGSDAAAGFPQYAQMKFVGPEICGTLTQTTDEPLVFHSSISCGISDQPFASVKRRSPPIGDASWR